MALRIWRLYQIRNTQKTVPGFSPTLTLRLVIHRIYDSSDDWALGQISLSTGDQLQVVSYRECRRKNCVIAEVALFP